MEMDNYLLNTSEDPYSLLAVVIIFAFAAGLVLLFRRLLRGEDHDKRKK